MTQRGVSENAPQVWPGDVGGFLVGLCRALQPSGEISSSPAGSGRQAARPLGLRALGSPLVEEGGLHDGRMAAAGS